MIVIKVSLWHEAGMDQVAALPFRLLPGVANWRGEAVDIMLVTSRDTGRWVLPKGNVKPGEPGPIAAAREASEEAGIDGPVDPQPIGHFSYVKREAEGEADPLSVAVYAMRVIDEAEEWPECKQRERRWFRRAEAAELVEEAELQALIAAFTG